MARYPGSDAMNTDAGAGVPTTSLGVAPYEQPGPGMSSIGDGDTSMAPMSASEGMSGISEGPIPTGGSAGTGTELASSPAVAPGAPGHDIVQGLGMANTLDDVTKSSTGETDVQAPNSSR